MLEPLRVPVTLDDNFKHLLKRMLEVDPNKRIKAQEILDCKWIKENSGPIIKNRKIVKSTV